MASFAAAAASAKYRARVDNTEDDDHEKDDLRKLAEMMKLIKMTITLLIRTKPTSSLTGCLIFCPLTGGSPLRPGCKSEGLEFV